MDLVLNTCTVQFSQFTVGLSREKNCSYSDSVVSLLLHFKSFKKDLKKKTWNYCQPCFVLSQPCLACDGIMQERHKNILLHRDILLSTDKINNLTLNRYILFLILTIHRGECYLSFVEIFIVFFLFLFLVLVMAMTWSHCIEL